ncbi:MAG TPA: ACT domain-containing protein, partial [Methanocorpusculum sp.]|nr:ACT domain-containing protein [Methanocorpusculum sp.]
GEIFTTLAEAGVNVMLISQGSSEMKISMIITEEQLETALMALAEVKQKGFIHEFEFDRNIAVVSVIGSGMVRTYGTIERIFHGLSVAGINVMLISQGSEVNVSFVVKQVDGIRAVRAIHEEYHLEDDE